MTWYTHRVQTGAAVVQAQTESAPAIIVTTEDQLAVEDKNKGAFAQLKELLVSEKQQVRYSDFYRSCFSIYSKLCYAQDSCTTEVWAIRCASIPKCIVLSLESPVKKHTLHRRMELQQRLYMGLLVWICGSNWSYDEMKQLKCCEKLIRSTRIH